MASTLYRRHSMAQLYEKLRAQDDDDDLAWLAQYSPDDKSDDEPYVAVAPSPPALSAVASPSPASSCSSGPSFSDPGFDHDSSDDPFDYDSDSDFDPVPISFGSLYAEFDPSSCSPLIFQSNDFTEQTASVDPPYIPFEEETSILQVESRSSPAVESDSPVLPILPAPAPAPVPSPAPILDLAVAPHRAARSTRNKSAVDRSPDMFVDSSDDAYSESDGNGSEDEYIPSPTMDSRKRLRSTRSAVGTVDASSQKRNAENLSRKRPRYSPLPRNAQATPQMTTPASKNNPWACPYCRWVQRNHRTPDLKRHIRTHTRLQRPAQWVCCGIPVKDAGSYDIPTDAKPYTWGGEMMVGGCCKEFSRRDALKRHLDNEHINCIGYFAAFSSVCEDDG